MIGHAPATLDTPAFRRPASRPSMPPAPGSWRYLDRERPWRTLWAAMLVSAGLHGLVLFGFNRHQKVVKPVVVDDVMTIALVMPELKELEEPENEVRDAETPAEAGLTVPTLADMPAQVDLSTTFVQQIDFSTLVPPQDLSAAKMLTIPTHYSHGGRIGEGIKIFELKDLDRPPEPTLKIAPLFPLSLKQTGMRADVTVEFIVDENGNVNNAFVVSSTDHRFDDAATTAIGKWKFRAGVKNGRRVNVRVRQPFPFRVTEDK